MNAPLRSSEIAEATHPLDLFAVFHLNLAFSSIEEEQRAEVIAQCYWPLLDLAARHGPIGLEATGFTLEEIARLDPEWIGRARALIDRGKIEPVGSGYAQIIGPLVPAAVTAKNLEIGNAVYLRLLGSRSDIALVNEQAYSAGLPSLYLDAGYQAILMDWDNCAIHHPEWPADARYRPQRALGTDGRSIQLIWTNTVAFQKLQRFAHGDIPLESYVDYLRGHATGERRAFCLYCSDAEIFDFRPGRYRTEETLQGGEWQRISAALEAIAETAAFRLVAPSKVLRPRDGGAPPLRLESTACPIPVKKQRKYNLSRWAVTGRDDIAINAACQRLYRGLRDSKADAAAWKELCYLWSSDFRTHITEKRWAAYCKRLAAAEAAWPKPSVAPSPARSGAPVCDRYIDIETPALRARLDRRRGLAIERIQFAGHARPALGGLPHGYFDDITLQADWYTGDCVFEVPGEQKVTDLEWCEVHRSTEQNGDVVLSGRVETPNGPIDKTLTFRADCPRVDFDLAFHWPEWGRGSLRLGHFTLLPEAFDAASLSLTTHNGGKEPETFALAGTAADHGAPVSFLVSSSYGLGMTEGWLDIGDRLTQIRIDVERETAPLLGLLTFRPVSGSFFCQLMLSALELDETRRPAAYRDGPRRFRFGVSARA